jgi:Na+/melibiose symporter-like transporter
VLFAGYLAVQSAVLLIALSFIGDSLQQADNTALRVAKVTVLVCLLSALVMVGGLALFHVYLLSTGQTTREVKCEHFSSERLQAWSCPRIC